MPLPDPPLYTPWASGTYHVTPSMRPFGTDFGNGILDRVLFQHDRELPRFLASKADCRREQHVGRRELSPDVETAARAFIVERLRQDGEAQGVFPQPEFDSPLERLIDGVLEDVAIVSTKDGRDWVSFVHVCSPSHWDPIEKLGRSFLDMHAVVPGFERINVAAQGLIDAMVRKGPFVRFVWGVETDDEPNHHPMRSVGREFDRKPFVMRVERQCLWGLPAVGAALFVIRVCFVSSERVLVEPKLAHSLRDALLSMSQEARRYKGVDAHFGALLAQIGL